VESRVRVLYIKSNSERNKAFQLRTTIFEDDKKYVAKEAITKEAISHIDNMFNSYNLLQESILEPKLKVVPTTKEDEKRLVFDFINGDSLEKKLKNATKEEQEALINEFKELLYKGFKSTTFDSKEMVNSKFKELFGELDYSELDGLPCFDGVSNLDYIFSNLIYSGDNIYLIDYEWSFNLNIPIDYILYRVAIQSGEFKDILLESIQNSAIFHKMERHFIDSFVMRDGFYHYKHKYMKLNLPINKKIQELEKQNSDLEERVEEYAINLRRAHVELEKAGEELTYIHSVVRLKDKQIDALRLKSRVKRAVNKLLGKKDEFDPFDPKNEPKKAAISGYKYKMPSLTPQIQEEISNFNKKPLISIITPVYNVDPKWLDLAIKSVEAQWYDNWELCIVDDKSTNEDTINYLKSINNPKIKVKFLEENGNISKASNEAVKLSSGEYLSLLDNDDELTPDALYEMVKAINKTNSDFLYSDEDFIDTKGNCSNPHFKPDFSPDLLLSHNYITHLSCFTKELFDEVGGFRSKYDGSQDYDLFLRMSEKTNNIHHIPKVLYHWRTLESSTSANSQAKPEAINRSKELLEETLQRRGIKAKVIPQDMDHYYRVKYEIEGNPLVSIIIPFKDKPELLETCVKSLLKFTTYQNFEVIGVSNNSEEEATFTLMKELEKLDPRVKFYEYNEPFNYAKINNYAVENFAKGEHILLLNNDIEIIHEGWLEAMLEHSQRAEIGCVGAKLLYPNNTIQHAGIIIGLGGYAGHSHKHYPKDNPGYFNRLNSIQNVSAVTAACLMVKRTIYQEVDGMDEVKFKVAYNDVDFCLRVREKGYLNLYTPYATMYHHESITRGYETTPEKIARFQTEKDALYERHKEILTNGDPYYNPNLCHDKEDFSICPQ